MCAIMSSSRWESSQRPLFVKSVWMNGYRHAILSKEDPAVKSKSAGSSIRSRSGKQPTRARSKSRSSSANDGLMIPAVQLLLANVHRLKQAREIKSSHPRQKLVKSFTLNVITTEHLAGKLKKEMTETQLLSKNKLAKTSYCSNSQNSEQKLCNERLEHCGASLTERVLLWLDLAGRFTNEMCTNHEEQENKIKARSVRKENKRHTTAIPRISTCLHRPANNDRTFVRRCTKNPNVKREDTEEVEAWRMENEALGVESFEDFSILKGGQRKLQLRNAIVESHREENIVTSQIEVVSIAPSKKSDHSSSIKKCPKAYCKRQVHIFMPLVAKRMTEYNSSVISESNDSSVIK